VVQLKLILRSGTNKSFGKESSSQLRQFESVTRLSSERRFFRT